MLTAGCDIGALTTKAAVIEDGRMLGCEIVRSRPKAVQSATDVMDKLLGRLSLSYPQIDYCISTGYGRNLVPFAQSNISEISNVLAMESRVTCCLIFARAATENTPGPLISSVGAVA